MENETHKCLILNMSDLFDFLSNNTMGNAKIELLVRCTGFTKQYCELALEENQLDFLKTYKQIIEHQLKKTLCN